MRQRLQQDGKAGTLRVTPERQRAVVEPVAAVRGDPFDGRLDERTPRALGQRRQQRQAEFAGGGQYAMTSEGMVGLTGE